MVVVALAFYSISFGSVEEQARIHEQSPDVMVYTENEEYSLNKGKSISIPVTVEIQAKGRQVDAKVAVFDVNVEGREFVETGEKTLPAGCTGSLDKSAIFVPASVSGEPGETVHETLMLTLACDAAKQGSYHLAPTVFASTADVSGFTSSSFQLNVT